MKREPARSSANWNLALSVGHVCVGGWVNVFVTKEMGNETSKLDDPT